MRIHHYETDSHFQLVESCGSYIVIDAQACGANAFGDLQSALWNIIGQIRSHVLSALTLQRLRTIGKKYNLDTDVFSRGLLECVRSNEIDNVFYDTAFFAMLKHYKNRKRYDLILANQVNFLVYKEVAHICKKYLRVTKRSNFQVLWVNGDPVVVQHYPVNMHVFSDHFFAMVPSPGAKEITVTATDRFGKAFHEKIQLS